MPAATGIGGKGLRRANPVLSFRLPQRLVKRIDEYAEQENRHRANMLQVLLQKALQDGIKRRFRRGSEPSGSQRPSLVTCLVDQTPVIFTLNWALSLCGGGVGVDSEDLES